MIIYYSGTESYYGDLVNELLGNSNVMMTYKDLRKGGNKQFGSIVKHRNRSRPEQKAAIARARSKTRREDRRHQQ